MEAVSIAFVTAIAAKAGVNFSAKIAGDLPADLFDYGTDGAFQKISRASSGRHRRSGIPLNYQLKATKHWEVKNDKFIKYNIEKKTYNDLVVKDDAPRTNPMILILLCLPDNFDHSVENDENSLVIKKCAYWHHLQGEPLLTAKGEEDNDGRTPILIPREQLFTADNLTTLIERTISGDLT